MTAHVHPLFRDLLRSTFPGVHRESAPALDGETFYDHLDACEQCREHPFDLCPAGVKLIHEAAAPRDERKGRP